MPITADELEVYKEVTTSQTALASLHPVRLDRWHRTLVGLPDVLYMQLGVQILFQHIDQAARALRAMIELLGAENLPLDAKEIARRHIAEFNWHLPSEVAEGGTHLFSLTWNKETSSWKLNCTNSEGEKVTKTVSSLEQALEKSQEWARELDEGP